MGRPKNEVEGKAAFLGKIWKDLRNGKEDILISVWSNFQGINSVFVLMYSCVKVLMSNSQCEATLTL